MPRLCWMMMTWGQRATWVIFGILDKGDYIWDGIRVRVMVRVRIPMR